MGLPLGAAFGVWLLFGTAQLAPSIELNLPAECEAAAADFQARATAAVVGTPARGRQARVTIVRRAAGYQAEIRIVGAAASGTKRVATASCSEAIAVSIAVLAVALSEPAGEGEAEARAGAVPEPAPTAFEAGDPAAASGEPAAGGGESAAVSGESAAASGGRDQDPPPEHDALREGSTPPVRFALRAGVDLGTLSAATGYLGALAALPAGPIEWRALVGYGFPSVEERIDPGIALQTREHFLWVDLGGCYGLGERFWLAACAAGELNVIRRARLAQAAPAEQTAVRLSGVLAAHLAYRGSALQPELELSAIAAALGEPRRRPLAFRASLGLGLQF